MQLFEKMLNQATRIRWAFWKTKLMFFFLFVQQKCFLLPCQAIVWMPKQKVSIYHKTKSYLSWSHTEDDTCLHQTPHRLLISNKTLNYMQTLIFISNFRRTGNVSVNAESDSQLENEVTAEMELQTWNTQREAALSPWISAAQGHTYECWCEDEC